MSESQQDQKFVTSSVESAIVLINKINNELFIFKC